MTNIDGHTFLFGYHCSYFVMQFLLSIYNFISFQYKIKVDRNPLYQCIRILNFPLKIITLLWRSWLLVFAQFIFLRVREPFSWTHSADWAQVSRFVAQLLQAKANIKLYVTYCTGSYEYYEYITLTEREAMFVLWNQLFLNDWEPSHYRYMYIQVVYYLYRFFSVQSSSFYQKV